MSSFTLSLCHRNGADRSPRTLRNEQPHATQRRSAEKALRRLRPSVSMAKEVGRNMG
jgi:hypothetical protein